MIGKEVAMRESPFIDDPRVLMRGHIARAVASPIEQVRAINIRAAEHQAALAKASGLEMKPAPDQPAACSSSRKKQLVNPLGYGS
jgi:hypothetical protein